MATVRTEPGASAPTKCVQRSGCWERQDRPPRVPTKRGLAVLYLHGTFTLAAKASLRRGLTSSRQWRKLLSRL